MCLGGGGSSKPQLQQRTLPAEGTRPADESTKKSSGSSGPKKMGNTLHSWHPSVTSRTAAQEYAETGDVTENRTIKRNDPGINL